ncbi:MAG: DUF6677 family protein [Planctomycetota bacterium]
MPEIIFPQDEGEPITVNLRDPYWAALLAWLFPGAGHFYQRRFAKGFLFMVCVLSTYFIGLGIGHGRVVYASSKKGDFRWQYGIQAATGIVALPALAQAYKTQDGADPYFVLCERYPEDYPIESKRFLKITSENNPENYNGPTLKDGLMAPPAGPISVNDMDTLGRWHFDYKHFFELGTLYTVVAGLLNMLAIYDAFCGPAILTPAQREEIENRRKRKRGDDEE